MAFTAEGRRKIDRLKNIDDVIFDIVRNAVDGLPETIAARIEKTGSGSDKIGGAAKKFSPYSAGWAAKRRKAGKQTSNKDFNYTGGFWDSYVVKDEKRDGNNLVFTLGVAGVNNDPDRKKGSKRTNERLADIHSEREGANILNPNGAELQGVEEEIIKKIDIYVRNAF